MISCEDAWLLGNLVKSIDPDAIIGLGPVPSSGDDKTFPSGFTIRSEKAPNARGVERALGSVLPYKKWMKAASSAGAVIVTGNYPQTWETPKLNEDQFLILVDTLPNALIDRADVVLPATTWAEKSGTFENCNNTLQIFEQALIPIGQAMSESQIAMDLKALVDDSLSTTFNAATVRRRMADAGVAGMMEIESPKNVHRVETDMPMSKV